MQMQEMAIHGLNLSPILANFHAVPRIPCLCPSSREVHFPSSVRANVNWRMYEQEQIRRRMTQSSAGKSKIAD